MRIEYIKLVNVMGIYVGQNKFELEINFNKSKNNIIQILAENSKGKTILLSSLHPFNGVGNIDDRNNLKYYIVGKEGYKEIRYIDNQHRSIVIKHYAKPNKDTHSIKSYISIDGNELNENGNVTSFLSLVELHMGLTPDMMRLLRLGSNVKTFVDLGSAERKSYIGKQLEDIDLYLKYYKKVNEDIKVMKVLIQTNNKNLINYHIEDTVKEEGKIKELQLSLREYNNKIHQLDIELGKIQQIVSSNNYYELLSKKNNIEDQLNEIEENKQLHDKLSLKDKSINKLNQLLSELNENRIKIQSNINSIRLRIDELLDENNKLQIKMKQNSVIDNLSTLQNLIHDIENEINDIPDNIKYIDTKTNSVELSGLINKLESYNLIGNTLYTFNKVSIDVYVKLIKQNKDIQKFISNQIRMNINRVSETDLKKLINQVFDNEMIITPNCNTEFEDCPYYRLYSIINEYRLKNDSEIYDDETLNQIKIISNNMDNILQGIYELSNIKLPEGFRSIFESKIIFNNLSNRISLFDLTELRSYLSLISAHEYYIDKVNKLKNYHHEMKLLKDNGTIDLFDMIKSNNNKISEYKNNLNESLSSMDDLLKSIDDINNKISIKQKYEENMKLQSMLIDNKNNIDKILKPLSEASDKERNLKYDRQLYQSMIDNTQNEINLIRNKLDEYNRLIDESKRLEDKFNKLNTIMTVLSTRKGIPLILMEAYLDKIKLLTNDLLNIIYDGELKIHKFIVDADVFEISFTRNGAIIPDIRYASQSELALITMALSFALASNLTKDYNILLLDEIDAGLDESNRSAFLKMLDRQMNRLHSEQVFVISHNLHQAVNLPTDVIKLGEITPVSSLQNIIYDTMKE